jgi:hypothetical protein
MNRIKQEEEEEEEEAPLMRLWMSRTRGESVQRDESQDKMANELESTSETLELFEEIGSESSETRERERERERVTGQDSKERV